MDSNYRNKTECPCYSECKDCAPGFQKVIDLKNAGLVIYRHTTHTEDVDPKTGNVEHAVDTTEDVYILHNTTDKDVSSADYWPEIEQNTIKCPRCMKIKEQARKLLKKGPTISGYDVKGICDHCKMKDASCHGCKEIVKSFLPSKPERTDVGKERVKHWLGKIKLLLDDTSKDKKFAHSIIHTDQVCRNLKSPVREPDVEQLFGPNKFDSNSTIQPSMDKKKVAHFPQLEKLEPPILFKDPLKRGGMTSIVNKDTEFSYTDSDISKTMLHAQPEKIKHSIIKYTTLPHNREVVPQVDRHDAFEKIFEDAIPLTGSKQKGTTNYKQRDITQHGYEKTDFKSPETKQSSKVKDSQDGRHRKYNSTETLVTKVKHITTSHLKANSIIFPSRSHHKYVMKHKSSSELIKHTTNKLLDKAKEHKNVVKGHKQAKQQSNTEKVKIEKHSSSAAKTGQKAPEFAEKTRRDAPKATLKTDLNAQKAALIAEKNTKIAEKGQKAPELAEKTRKDAQKSTLKTEVDVQKPALKTEKNAKKTEKDFQQAKKDARIAEKYQKTTQKAEADAQKAALKAELDAQKAALTAEKNAKIAEKDSQPAKKDDRIAEKNQKDAKKATLIAEKNAKIAEKDLQQAKKDAQVTDRIQKDAQSAALKAELDAQKAALRAEFDAQQKKDSKADKNAAKAEKDAAKAEKDTAKAEKDALRAEKLAQKAALKSETNAKKGENDALQAKNDARQAKHDAQKDREKAEKDALQKVEKASKEKDGKTEKRGILDDLIERAKKENKRDDNDMLKNMKLFTTSTIKELFPEKRLKTDGKTVDPALDDLISKLVKLKQLAHEGRSHHTSPDLRITQNYIEVHCEQHTHQKNEHCLLCANSDIALEFASLCPDNEIKSELSDIIVGQQILKFKPPRAPMEDDSVEDTEEHEVNIPMNVYRMRPAHPEFDWFEHNKKKRLMEYDTGEKLAEFDENGRGRWFYRNGRMALVYYDAEEQHAGQRFVVYSNGEPDERGRSRPYTLLATFDYLGNGIVFDHTGKIRLKYNQTEGVVLDRSIGPVSHWKWHTLNDPPVLQQVMLDTQIPHKDPEIIKLGKSGEEKPKQDDEDMLAIEFDNIVKEKSKKLSQTFRPFQIRMKALKINEHFSLRVLDQATVYLLYRDGTTNLKLNIGMVLDNKEIVDTDTADVGNVSSNLEKLPARTESLAGLQKSIAIAQQYDRMRTERERKLHPGEANASVDKLVAGISRPIPRQLLTTVPSGSPMITAADHCKCNRRPTATNVYYDTRFY